MGTVTEVQLEDLKQKQIAQRVPRSHVTRLLGISLVVAIWIWAAFVRGHSPRLLQLLFLVVIAGCAGGFFSLITRAISARFLIGAPEATKVVAFASSAFLLLAVFFPEYLLGKPALVKSLALAGLSLLLFIFYLLISLRVAQPGFSFFKLRFSARKALVIFCAA